MSVLAIDFRPFAETKCPYCGLNVAASERSATFSTAQDETWSRGVVGDADYIDLIWLEWSCPNSHTGPSLVDLPGMVSAREPS